MEYGNEEERMPEERMATHRHVGIEVEGRDVQAFVDAQVCRDAGMEGMEGIVGYRG
jgi:hypothetical protein